MVVIDGGHDQPGLPARAARPPRAAHGRGRHRLARPPAGCRARSCPMRHADVALVQAAIALARRRDRRRARRASTRSPAAGARRPTRTSAHRRPAPPRAVLPPRASAQIGPDRYRVDGRRRAGSRSQSSASAAHERRLELRRAPLPHADLAAGRRPAGRGRRRPAPDLARRRRPRAQPRARRRGRRSPSPSATRSTRATSSRSSRA